MDLSHPLRSAIPSLDGAVLEVLAGIGDPHWGIPAGRITAIATEGSESGVRLVLARLVRHGLVIEEVSGRNTFYRANRAHLIWPFIQGAVDATLALEIRIAAEIEHWNRQPLSTAIFGSVARGTAGADSDIDLLLVWPESASPDEIAEREHELAIKIESFTGNRVQLYSLDRESLLLHIARGEAIITEWEKDARTITGQDFRKLVKDLDQ